MVKRWIMGCGDIGRRLARLYQNEQRSATGWVKSSASFALAEAQGLPMYQGDLDSEALDLPLELFADASVFWFMPPPAQGIEDTRLRRFLKAVSQTAQYLPRRVLLISTTGVYGDCAGRWIDETEPLKPTAARSKRRADAEAALRTWGQEHQREWVILRVPGIYAADRLPLARLQRGEPVLLAEQAPWTNRIHADDLASVAKIAMERAPSAEIYNATDGHPSTMTDYFNQVADFANLPRPPQVSLAEAETSVSAGMFSYLQESRRIGNAKLLSDLALELQYPDLAAGLAAAKASQV